MLIQRKRLSPSLGGSLDNQRGFKSQMFKGMYDVKRNLQRGLGGGGFKPKARRGRGVDIF